jgi:hypothetical protein
VAGWNIFRAYIRAVSPLFAPQRSQQCFPSRTDEKPARANLTCASESTIIPRGVTSDDPRTGFTRCFSSSKRTDRFAKDVARQSSQEYFPVARALQAVSRTQKAARNRLGWAPAGRQACEYRRSNRAKSISLCARILAGTAREVFLSQSRDPCRSAPHRLWTS